VLRDTTERVIIASKGRFDRVGRGSAETGQAGVATIPGDEFLEATLDVWEIPAESATRVGHPAPFPVALVERCIQLFTFEGDVVLDPFMGSGTSAVAAVNTGRRFIGYDTEPTYVHQARERVASMVPGGVADRRTLKEMARTLLDDAGYVDVEDNARVAPGVTVSFRATGPDGVSRLFELGGSHTPSRPGLGRIEVVWRTIAKAAVAREALPYADLVVITSGTVRGGPMASVVGPGRPILAVVDATRHDATERLVAIHQR
jgi:site-specific DNA-methyltransferase (adenine-specific)